MTDQTARAEAGRRYRERVEIALTARPALIEGFEAGAEWARAQALAGVRAGIEALHEIHVITWPTGFQAVSKTDALAVLDRAAGETGEDDEH